MLPLVVVAQLVLAQEFGLDLTEEGPELRPSIALIGISTDAQRIDSAARAGDSLLRFVEAGAFSRIVPPAEARSLLDREGEVADAMSCRDAECMTQLCHRLGVDRVIIGELSATELTLLGHDWGEPTVESAVIPAKLLGGRDLDRRLAPFVQPLLTRLAVPLGQLRVRSEPPASEVRVGERVVGQGAELDVTVPAGSHVLRVSAPEHLDHEEPVTVASAGVQEVAVTLKRPKIVVAEPVMDPSLQAERERRQKLPEPRKQKSAWQRPGLWTALAGAAAVGVGIGFGLSAQNVKRRAVDANGDGVLEVTRREVQGARRDAQVANIAGGVGLAALAGGGVWFFFDGGAGGGIHGSF